MGSKRVRFRQNHQAEAPVVGENDAHTLVGGEDDMIVRAMAAAVPGVLFCAAAAHERLGVVQGEIPRHPHMHDQRLAAVEVGKQIFRPPVEADHTPPTELLREAGREGDAQIVPAGLNLAEDVTFERGRQASAYGLDFGQLGHGRIELIAC